MIEDLLTRSFVLEQAEQIEDALASSTSAERRRSSRIAPAVDLDEEDVREALERLREARLAEATHSSGQPGYEPVASERRGEAPPPIDERSFFSRDPVLSNVQSALEEYIEEREPEAIVAEAPRSGRRSGSDDGAPLTGRRLKDGASPGSAVRRIGEKFSPTDIGWVSSLFAQGIRLFRKKHRFNPQPASPRPIDERARIILVGDWGTGIPRAVKVAAEIRKVLDQGRDEGVQQHVIHLGDVYYSGWSKEYTKRFLPHWPVDAAQAGEITSWSVNANHDMYAGGHGYFDTLLGDARFHAQQASSFFSLFNSRWRILGLDTGWEDAGLQDPQAEWVRAETDAAAAAGQKVLLLSHHQLFSAFESGNDKLAAKLRAILDGNRIHSWIWGHEHRCVLYAPAGGLQFAACLGNGGVPVYMTHAENDPLPAPAIYEYRARMQHGIESWALFGFAILDLDGDAIRIRLVDENGKTHKQHTVR